MSRLDAALQPPVREPAPRVPRRAVFDDLRVGQLVAVVGMEERQIGTIHDTRADSSNVPFVVRDWTGVVVWHLRPDDDAEVFILRDPPAAPVTVQRAEWDAWVRDVKAFEDYEPGQGEPFTTAINRLHDAARALIDNADTGDKQPPGFADPSGVDRGMMQNR